MEDFFDQSKAKAFVHMLSDGDHTNKMMISDDQLLVIRKGQKKLFALKDISALKTENKKILFPLISGGIITPFAFLSYFVNLFHPLFHLAAILFGMFLFYYGWVGKSSLTIVFRNQNELNYYLPSISKNLLAFVEFAEMLHTGSGSFSYENLLFFEVDRKSADVLFDESNPSRSASLYPIFGFTYKQLLLKGGHLYSENLIAIDPLKAGREIKLFFDTKSNQMRPVLEGPISKESIIDRSKFQ